MAKWANRTARNMCHSSSSDSSGRAVGDSELIFGPRALAPGPPLRATQAGTAGGGFGSASLNQIRPAIEALSKAAATDAFQFHAKTAPLRDIEALWNSSEGGPRLEYQP
jgi:hypothetical protein